MRGAAWFCALVFALLLPGAAMAQRYEAVDGVVVYDAEIRPSPENTVALPEVKLLEPDAARLGQVIEAMLAASGDSPSSANLRRPGIVEFSTEVADGHPAAAELTQHRTVFSTLPQYDAPFAPMELAASECLEFMRSIDISCVADQAYLYEDEQPCYIVYLQQAYAGIPFYRNFQTFNVSYYFASGTDIALLYCEGGIKALYARALYSVVGEAGTCDILPWQEAVALFSADRNSIRTLEEAEYVISQISLEYAVTDELNPDDSPQRTCAMRPVWVFRQVAGAMDNPSYIDYLMDAQTGRVIERTTW